MDVSPDNAESTTQNGLYRLNEFVVGASVSEIIFVMDYVTFHFANAWLSFLLMPTVAIGDLQKEPTDLGYLTLLWEQLGQQVVEMDINLDTLRMKFGNDVTFTVDLTLQVETVLAGDKSQPPQRFWVF